MKKYLGILLLFGFQFSFAQQRDSVQRTQSNQGYLPPLHPTNNIDNNLGNSDGHTAQVNASGNFARGIGTNANIENGIGFSFKVGLNTLKNLDIPIGLMAGLGFDYLYFGGKKSYLGNNASLAVNSNGYGWYPYADLDLFPDWPITPFACAYYGFRFYFTRQNISYFDRNNVKKTESNNIDGDNTKIYGYGGGLKIRLADHIKMELRYQRNFGQVAKIIDPQTIVFDQNTGNLKSYQNVMTNTDFDMLFVGVLLCF